MHVWYFLMCQRHLTKFGIEDLYLNYIDGDLLTWITDYLDDRKQRVVKKSYMSSFKNVKAGVPQGSVLGPLLFLILVNDISSSLLSLTRLFVDDVHYFVRHLIKNILRESLIMILECWLRGQNNG